ncbi:hypothetical protein KY284_005366 [Solanum tuberosum]|nr:hypothetical protein KY284_005366 [Solanum tuberosum]
MVGIKRGRGRSKEYWERTIDKEMVHLELTEDMTLERGFGGHKLGYKINKTPIRHCLTSMNKYNRIANKEEYDAPSEDEAEYKKTEGWKAEYKEKEEQAQVLEELLQGTRTRQKEIMDERKGIEKLKNTLLAQEKSGKIESTRNELVAIEMQMDVLRKYLSNIQSLFP